MPFPYVCLLQSGEWMSRFGLSRVSDKQENPGGLTYLGWVVCGVTEPLVIALSPNCLFATLPPL